MKDVTMTSFGLVVAYVLPGLVALYSLTFWSSNLKEISRTFYTAQSDLGLSIMILAASVVVGLQVNAIRFLCYERLLCRLKKIEPDVFKKLVQSANLSAFTTLLEENFRYHQFFGSMTLLLPLLEAGLFKHLNHDVPDYVFIVTTTLFTLVIAFLIFLRHEIRGGTAGLKNFVWCYGPVKTFLSQKIGRKKALVWVWLCTTGVAVFYATWLMLYQGISNRILVVTLAFGFVVLEVTTGTAAIVALRRYVERTTHVLQ